MKPGLWSGWPEVGIQDSAFLRNQHGVHATGLQNTIYSRETQITEELEIGQEVHQGGVGKWNRKLEKMAWTLLFRGQFQRKEIMLHNGYTFSF